MFPGIHRFVTYTHMTQDHEGYMITGSVSVSRDTQVRYYTCSLHTCTHTHAHMITGSVSVSRDRDTQVRYYTHLHIHTRTHDHRICECFQGYTGSLLTHMYSAHMITRRICECFQGYTGSLLTHTQVYRICDTQVRY